MAKTIKKSEYLGIPFEFEFYMCVRDIQSDSGWRT